MEFEANKVKESIVEWVRNWFEQNGPNCNAIIGISGGKDSSVVAAICVEALGKDRVIGVLMPNGEQSDIDVSQKLVEHLEIKNYTINIRKSYDGIMSEIDNVIPSIENATIVNLPARLRMSTLYAIAQSCNGRVANTCNLSEDWVGYATRYGDAAGDFSPLSQLTVTEVKKIGKAVGLPSLFTDKAPIDGLCGKTDEENLGFTYDTLDKYIRTGVCEDESTKQKIDRMHAQNKFKLFVMDCFKYELPDHCLFKRNNE